MRFLKSYAEQIMIKPREQFRKNIFTLSKKPISTIFCGKMDISLTCIAILAKAAALITPLMSKINKIGPSIELCGISF